MVIVTHLPLRILLDALELHPRISDLSQVSRKSHYPSKRAREHQQFSSYAIFLQVRLKDKVEIKSRTVF